MRTEKSVKEKIKEIEKKFPGIAIHLKGYDLDYYPHLKRRYRHPHDRGYAVGFIEDIEILETQEELIVGVKWEEHSWNGKGSVEWWEWVQLFYKKREGEIHKATTEKAVTRCDKFSNSRIWEFDFVKLNIEEKVPTILLVNKKGETLPSLKRWFYKRAIGSYGGSGVLLEKKAEPPLSRKEEALRREKHAKENGYIWLGTCDMGDSGC